LGSSAAPSNVEGSNDEPQESEIGVPTVEIDHAKLRFRAPYFDKNATYTKARCELDNKVALKFRDASLRYMNLLLVNDMQSLPTKDYGDIMNAFSLCQYEHRQLKLTDESTIQESFIQMLLDLLDYAAEAPSSHAIDPSAAYLRLEVAAEGIRRLIKASPMGAYLRWDEATVNGQSLKSYLEPVVATIYARRAYFAHSMSVMFRDILNGNY